MRNMKDMFVRQENSVIKRKFILLSPVVHSSMLSSSIHFLCAKGEKKSKMNRFPIGGIEMQIPHKNKNSRSKEFSHCPNTP